VKVNNQGKITKLISEAYQKGYKAGHAAGLKEKAKELSASIEKMDFKASGGYNPIPNSLARPQHRVISTTGLPVPPNIAPFPKPVTTTPPPIRFSH